MEPAEIPAAWLEMIRAGDRAAFAELSVPELVCHGPGGSSSGRAEFLGWLDWYGNAFAGPRPRVDDVISSGDRVVARSTTTSTYQGGFLALPTTGQWVREEGIIIIRLSEGKVAEFSYQGNDLEIAGQLGGQIMVAAQSEASEA
jgi:predicted ester cyclase